MRAVLTTLGAMLALMAGCASGPQASAPSAAVAVPAGEVKEGPVAHTPESLRLLVREAQVALPAAAGAAFFGKFKDVPATATTRVPVVVFLHGSSGLGLSQCLDGFAQCLAGDPLG